MGNCWAQCCGIFRREANRIQRGGGSRYFRSSTTGEHYTIEFENLVESDEAESPGTSPRAVNDDEIVHLREQRYAAISDKQTLIDLKLHAELAAQEEKLRIEEEAKYAAQRVAARVAWERRHAELRVTVKAEVGGIREQTMLTTAGDFQTSLQCVKAQPETFRSSRVSSETNVATPNTESSCDFTSKTRSTNDDGTSLDLEWEDEEGMNRMVLVRERSRTEEDILRAVACPAGWTTGSGPASASEDSAVLEWENDFIRTHAEDTGDSEGSSFINPLLDTSPSWEGMDNSNSDRQDR